MNSAKIQQTRWFTLVYVAAASAFLVLVAMGMAGIGRTVLKAIPVCTLMVLVLRDMRGFARICLTGALLGSVCGDILLDLPYANRYHGKKQEGFSEITLETIHLEYMNTILFPGSIGYLGKSQPRNFLTAQ